VDYAAFLQAAERGQPPAVALLHGADEQLLDDALDLVTRGLFADPTERALGREVLEGEEISVEAVTRSAATLPLMTQRRLVIVRRAHLLPARDRETLTAYARDPNPSTCLLLVADDVLPGARGRVDHWLLGALPPAAIVGLPVRRGRGVEDWLKQRAAAEGLTVADDAARLLVQWVGDDGARLRGEARKAALLGGSDNRRVGVDEVSAIVGEQRVSAAFDLSRAVERGISPRRCGCSTGCSPPRTRCRCSRCSHAACASPPSCGHWPPAAGRAHRSHPRSVRCRCRPSRR
jgi:DNA polymerase-3 subunit delta